MTQLSAGHPIETPHHPVGRRTFHLTDPTRASRSLGVDLWYPAVASNADRSVYELLPGISYSSAHAQHEPAAHAGRFPLVLFSHGRTGMRVSYAFLCEALAARGAVVASADHPGDALADWLVGNNDDDRTNEVNRVADAHFVLHALLSGDPALPVDVVNAIDHERIVLAGHSYGAYTAFATAAGSRGVAAHDQVRAIVGLQSYTRTMSDSLLGRITQPTLIVVSGNDQTTPAPVDADRPWALLRGHPTWRLDLDGAGHQVSSDIALYAELAAQVPDVPQLVRDYLEFTAAGSQPIGGRSWRDLLAIQVAAIWAFLQVVLELDSDEGMQEAQRLEAMPGISLRRR
ncbi:MAG: alpha/beta fold hydrolase [Actinomycetia bacterium]|nr:alpha/beta fold hydrolase [Actinomycetes bacterium]